MPYRRTLSLCYKRNSTKLERTSLSADVCKGLLYGICSLILHNQKIHNLFTIKFCKIIHPRGHIVHH